MEKYSSSCCCCCLVNVEEDRGFQSGTQNTTLTAPRSDPKKLEKLEKVETKSQGRSALSQGMIFLKVCRQDIFVSRSGSVRVFSRCLQVFSCVLKVTQSFLKVNRQQISAVLVQLCNPCLMVYFDTVRSLKVQSHVSANRFLKVRQRKKSVSQGVTLVSRGVLTP